MNKLFRRVVDVRLFALVLLGFACSSSDSWTCQDATTCAKAGGAMIKACCTSDNKKCKYTVGSTDYPCNGTDCNAAAQTVAKYCVG